MPPRDKCPCERNSSRSLTRTPSFFLFPCPSLSTRVLLLQVLRSLLDACLHGDPSVVHARQALLTAFPEFFALTVPDLLSHRSLPPKAYLQQLPSSPA
eukprot:5702294-Pleurochrysis_carterae.AAC.1